MIAEDLAYRGFSCPQAGLDQSFLEMLVVEHARQTLKIFIDRHQAWLEQNASGLIPVLVNWLACTEDESFNTVWDPAFGGIFAALLEGTDDISQRAGGLGLRLHECHHGGQWELHPRTPVHFRFDRWLLPVASDLEVSATAEDVSIGIRNGREFQKIIFVRHENEWRTKDAPPLPVLAAAGTRLIVLGRELLQTWEFQDLRKNMDNESPERLIRGCITAIDLLAEHADIYLTWVKSVVKYLVPWQTLPGQLPSGSSSSNCAPGVIGIGNHDHALALTDSLVHEASHHYYYILSKLGALDDGTDSALYFNPFLERNRPIHFILLAYHAFGNVLLLFRTLRADGFSHDEYVIGREQQLITQLGVLELALQTTKALTPLGRALWEPLYEQIHY